MQPTSNGEFERAATGEAAQIDIVAIITALLSGSGTFWQRLSSRKLLLVLIAQLPAVVIAIQAVRQQLPAQWGAVAAGAALFLNAVYVAANAYENAQTARAAATVATAHLQAQTAIATARIAAARG